MNSTINNLIINRKWLYQIPRISIYIFIILNLCAMLLYPGGTISQKNNQMNNYSFTEGYSFSENFFSDLGSTEAHNGQINFFSSFFFNLSLIIVGITMFLFHLNLYDIFKGTKLNLIVLVAGICGCIGGLCFVGVGLTPSNLYLPMHIVFNDWAFRSYFLCALLTTAIIFKSDKLDNSYSILYILFSISILLYIFILEFAPSPTDSNEWLRIHVIAQKFIVFCFIFSTHLLSIGFLNYFRTNNKIT